MSKLDINQMRFVVGVSTATRIDPRVVIAWMQSEGANAPGGTGHFNYLNLRPYKDDSYAGTSTGGFEQFSSVNQAITATVRRLNQPFAKPILATARTKPTPAQQINAIASTGWDSGHYGGAGGPKLVKVFSQLFKNPQDSYLDPLNARSVADAVDTGSASSGDPIGGTPSIPGAVAGAAGSAADHIPGVKQVKDIDKLISWIGDNWDRIGWVTVGLISVFLGATFVFLSGKNKVTATASGMKGGK